MEIKGNISNEASKNASSMYSGQSSILIMVIGKSGRGKSTAIRNLDPEKTHIITPLGKPLPFPKGIQYTTDKNLTITPNPDTIRRAMKEISSKSDKTSIVIDDAQYIMASEFMDKAMIKGYDKFTIMARNIWEILVLSTKLREGLKIFFMVHEEDTGAERKMKTLGKLLDDKITPEGLSTIVLYADVAGERDNRKYFFTTQSDGVTNAKSPFDMFPYIIPNDLKLVSSRIDEYYKGVSLDESKLNFKI